MSQLHQYRESVLHLGYDFVKAQVLQTAFELNIFELLDRGSRTAFTLAEELNANPQAMELFLNALVALGLLAADGRAYRNTKYGLEIFLKDKPYYIGDIIALQKDSAPAWLRLKDSIMTGRPLDRPPFESSDPEEVERFARAMQNTAMGHAELLARKLTFESQRTLLDLGGGPGVFSIYFAKANPDLRITIFDSARTLRLTRANVSREGLTDRISFQEGDFFKDEIEGNFDACFLSHIIHGLTPERNEALFQKISAHVNPGGCVIVQDFFLKPDRQAPQSAALFALHMLIHTDGGRTYSFGEVSGWMKNAGFRKTHRPVIRLPRSIALLVGEK